MFRIEPYKQELGVVLLFPIHLIVSIILIGPVISEFKTANAQAYIRCLAPGKLEKKKRKVQIQVLVELLKSPILAYAVSLTLT